ncbi:Ketohexokinase [Seminavis robusta]|uniref:Ketohexokinase n=1 Tax=Seminavis robusta TaxID=568900 RepID=A0A9N8EK82_9STRA|nr:Ketohexokinase [Seminavis robusta]|eukprot:Sro1122_g243490.1 Ketohexokinase (400) ;mRNA; r:10022-11221
MRLLLPSLVVSVFLAANNVSAMATTKPRILSFGIAAVDFVAVVDHFPDPDEKMRSSSLLVAGGGNAANSACAMGRLSDYCQVDVATAVGDDANANTIIDGIAENNVGVEYVEKTPGGSSPFSYILTTPDNARTIIHQPSTRDMSLEFANTIPLSQYDAVHFDCRHPAAAVLLAEKCFDKKIPYSLDVERPREGLDELMDKATVVICNSDFCDTMLGKPDKDNLSDLEIANRLKQVIKKKAPNCKIALQTLGGKGSCLVRMNTNNDGKDGTILETDEKGHVPLVTQHDGALWCAVWGGCDVVDSTGAGDAFQGGFAVALWSYLAANPDQSLETAPPAALARSMRIATRVAAKKLEAPGARDGLPRSSEDGPLQEEFQGLGVTASAAATKKSGWRRLIPFL